MTQDIISFWAKPKIRGLRMGGFYVHPSDRNVIVRINHKFDLKCLPCPFVGPVKSARVVLLYLNPGLSKEDGKEAQSQSGLEHYKRKLTGLEPLSSEERHRAAWKWWTSRVKVFGDPAVLRDKIAILEIGAYHSKSMANTSVLAALPSSRAMLNWAQETLFGEAMRGERVVICMRAARFWGLSAGKSGQRYGRSLYAPAVARSGHLAHGQMREEIIKKVRSILARRT